MADADKNQTQQIMQASLPPLEIIQRELGSAKSGCSAPKRNSSTCCRPDDLARLHNQHDLASNLVSLLYRLLALPKKLAFGFY